MKSGRPEEENERELIETKNTGPKKKRKEGN